MSPVPADSWPCSCPRVPVKPRWRSEVSRSFEIAAGLRGGMIFHADGASFPYPAHGAWWLAQMRRWQHVPANTDDSIIDRIWRPDLWRLGAVLAGEPEPAPSRNRFAPIQPAGDLPA